MIGGTTCWRTRDECAGSRLVLAVVAAIAGCLGQAAADEADGGADDVPASRVAITSDVGPSSEPCVSGLLARLALTRDVIDTTELVQRRDPRRSSAVLADLGQGGGVRDAGWGQRMAADARRGGAFEVGQVGTVTVTFDKPCE